MIRHEFRELNKDRRSSEDHDRQLNRPVDIRTAREAENNHKTGFARMFLGHVAGAGIAGIT